MLRILLLAPSSNPDGTHGSLIGYSHAEALAQLHAVTVVIHHDNEEAVRRKQAPFCGIEVVRLPWLDRIHAWCFRWIFRNNYASQVLTAFNYLFCLAFEWRAWRQTRARIMTGDFDVVLRLLPISSVLPSPFAFFLRRGPIPFVIGPINGGLPWPTGFRQADKQKEWISNLRGFYRLLPFARSTYRCAKLKLIFVGGLVPIKAVDLALRGAASLLQAGHARFTIVGDGPERASLEQLTKSLGIQKAVSFCGWLRHGEVLQRMGEADVLVFPSVREFGGGVVFESLAMGAVPVVADFGGPGDIVHPEIGFKVPLTNEEDVVLQIEKILSNLHGDRGLLERLRQQGMRYAREYLSWERKAQLTSQILTWAVGQGPKPDLPPPQVARTLELLATPELTCLA